MWGDGFSTVQDTFSTVEVVQLSEGITSVQWGIASVLDIQCTGGRTSVHVGITSVQWRDNVSTVEGIQYSGRRILISACLVINNDEKISILLYYDMKFSFGSFSKIQADFMPFESWTGVLQVQPCF